MDEYQIKNFLKFSPVLFGWVPKKRLFIHIPKNGGMAIREAAQLDGTLVIANRRRLKSRKYADGLKNHMAKTGGNPGYEHARLRDVDLSVRKATRAFAIVRNPWSRTVSRFKFSLQTRDHGTQKPAFTPDAFETFLEERHVWGNEAYFWHRAVSGWYPQQDYVVDERGEIAVDLLRQEHLSREIQTYLGFEGELNRRNVSKASSADYRDLYTPRTIQIVADWYGVDIDRFGFDFDTPATRNTLFSSADGA
ncbi:MAG: sulfotransferase family 2 domain-containing protein [Roseibium sp.]|uniref:sulfotransferase family 2 domain-containing protein n=1 Tax=Roseibium sp. TaxID=1936156 RepID=UPI001B14711A|nr:sulfotransferase family 2 domain-containing protein [Roseibium sp.]MBO6891891.1 sulfotransferase family 2 domain-containing protein [Roseibium sp.]MBO6929242.1 sulfotransferase family 2 domain-containing protein [Roseibium sp.]